MGQGEGWEKKKKTVEGDETHSKFYARTKNNGSRPDDAVTVALVNLLLIPLIYHAAGGVNGEACREEDGELLAFDAMC